MHFLVKKNQWCYFALLLSPEFLLFFKEIQQKKKLPVPDQCHLGNCNLSLCHSGKTEQVLIALADSIFIQPSKTQAAPKQSIAFIIAEQEAQH